mmetsp:Transcript_43379/g.114736  ORF Transcript_43379/g.114736 Transcript_43379/m.114736 type:complete len:265 (+) Transcript_43379:45-839(+)
MAADGVLNHLAKSKYSEDTWAPGHRSVWGSYYDSEAKRWGFSCCNSTDRFAGQGCKPLESDSESSRGSGTDIDESGAKRDSLPSVLEWRPRDEFETQEGFIVHATRYMATCWRTWLRDGTLANNVKAAGPDMAKVLLSEANALAASRGVEVICQRLDAGEVAPEITRHLEEFCLQVGAREYADANKAYMEMVFGNRKWQGDVPYLVDGNRNGPSVVQGIAEQINKKNTNPLDAAGIRDHTVQLRRLMAAVQAVRPNENPSRNNG